MYVKVSSTNVVLKYPYGPADLEEDNPNTSFPLEISDESLECFGVYRVHDAPPPEVNYDEILLEQDPILSNGVWTKNWKVEKASAEEMEFRLDHMSRMVRVDRNRRLADTDWVMLEDANVSPELKEKYKEYRQALRDLSSQEGFPWAVEWPSF